MKINYHNFTADELKAERNKFKRKANQILSKMTNMTDLDKVELLHCEEQIKYIDFLLEAK